MKRSMLLFGALLAMLSCTQYKNERPTNPNRFVYIEDQNLVKPCGETIILRGINLANWLNPEGHMFYFNNTSSYRLINEAFSEMIGPDFTNWFWREFRKSYITHEDIKYIKQIGLNTVRVPFHYKMFSDEDYMGTHGQEYGFEVIDSLVNWCKQEKLYIILNMENAPGGQTGDIMDDGYGYPWLFESEENKKQFCDIWKNIAHRYANDTIIIGYDLLNEPLAQFFTNKDSELNDMVEPLYKRCVDSIRRVDPNHIVMLAGTESNTNMEVFRDPYFDSRLMYITHKFNCDTTQKAIADIVHFRDSVNRPLYVGETGQNTNKWIKSFTNLLERNNLSWCLYPYKDMTTESCMKSIRVPSNWYLLVQYAEQNRSDMNKIRANRPDQVKVRRAMLDFLDNMKFKNCNTNNDYIKALGMQP